MSSPKLNNAHLIKLETSFLGQIMRATAWLRSKYTIYLGKKNLLCNHCFYLWDCSWFCTTLSTYLTESISTNNPRCDVSFHFIILPDTRPGMKNNLVTAMELSESSLPFTTKWEQGKWPRKSEFSKALRYKEQEAQITGRSTRNIYFTVAK